MKLRIILIILSIVFFNITNCSKENVVQPPLENHRPEILSLVVFPEVIGPKDSVIVICEAIDPDGDTLVYDWITDGRVKIKGAHANDHWLYHTYQNSRVFYPKDNINLPIDTLWIQSFARDGKGKSANGIVLFVVNQSLRR